MNMKTFTTKCSILALLLLLLTQGVYAQTKEGNNWYFGYGGRMTWNTTQIITNGGKTLIGLPTPITTPSAMNNQNEGVFCMSDLNGDLLFYSDGMTIWNRNNQVMQNGSGMFGHNSSAQSGIVIPYPGQPGKYIAVSVSLNMDNHPQFPGSIGNRVAYSIIDMSLDGGLGAVTSEKNVLLTGAKGALGESLSAVRHSNGVDIWIVAVGKGSSVNSSLNVWGVTTAGVNTVCHGSYPLWVDTNTEATSNGYLRFSVDGQYFAWAERNTFLGEYTSNSTNSRRLFFGRFNTSTGTFPMIKSIITENALYGVEFSPSTELLYTNGGGVSIYKFAELLVTPNPSASVSRRHLSGVFVEALQLGPDGRIYGTRVGNTGLLVIDNPDNYNNATAHELSGLMAGTGRYGLPNFLPHIFIPIPDEGIIGSDQTVCSGSTPAQLTSVADAKCDIGSGLEPVTYLWQRSTDGTTWSTAAGATNLAAYQPPVLATTTHFRRRATSANCGEMFSNVITITVTSAITAGSISGIQTLCSGGIASTLTSVSAAGGGTGITYRWQSSPNGSTAWSDIAGTAGAGTIYSPGTVSTTTYYRRTATGADCGGSNTTVNSNVVTVTVAAPFTAGSISGNQSICSNSTATTLTSTTAASGGSGTTTYNWQQSTNGTTWTNATGTRTNATYSPGTLSATTHYRRQAENSCGTVESNTVIVTVALPLVAGSIGNAQTLCSGNTAATLSSTTAASGGTGIITYRWQSSPNGSTWTDITGTAGANATYSPGVVATTTHYRRNATGTDCNGSSNTVNSNTVVITVAENISAGAIGSNQSICSGNTAATLTSTTNASGGTGTLTYRWQSSTNGTSWNDITGTAGANATYSPGTLTATTHYRRNVTGTDCNGSTNTVSSNVVIVTVTAAISAGSIGGSGQNICAGDIPSTLTSTTAASGGTGTLTYRWQSSTNGTTWSDITGTAGANATYSPGALSATTHYRRTATGTDCGGSSNTVNSNVIIVTVSPLAPPSMIKIQ